MCYLCWACRHSSVSDCIQRSIDWKISLWCVIGTTPPLPLLLLFSSVNRSVKLKTHRWTLVYTSSYTTQRISGEFLAEQSLYILCCYWNFSTRSFLYFFFLLLRKTQTNIANNWPVCIFRVNNPETAPSLAALWLCGKKKVFWHQSEPRAIPTIWN